MSDSRTEIRRLIIPLHFSALRAVFRILVSLALAAVIAFAIPGESLGAAARWSLFILVLAAGLWILEAIPAFAVALLVIGLQIAILGRPGGVFAQHSHDWERFIVVWGSPLIWLFFGGFVMAAAAEKAGLTHWIAGSAIRHLGHRPSLLLPGCMLVTFVFSMFISNTATATMMLVVLLPLLKSLADADPLRKGLLLGVAFSANLGGMGTLIGSPPNAVAAGTLSSIRAIDFMQWMLVGLPPAVLLLALTWAWLAFRYPTITHRLIPSQLEEFSSDMPEVPLWRRLAVVTVFLLTIGLWLSSSWHGLPATVIAFLPVCVLTALGIVDSADIRQLPWDVLLLIAGGLSLGVGVTDTGLAEWLVQQLPLKSMNSMGLILLLVVATSVLSNLMSNTAAVNILIPIAVAATAGFESPAIVAIALAASSAMCLPISTPPNSIVFGTQQLKSVELLQNGLLLGLVAPFVITGWCWLMLSGNAP